MKGFKKISLAVSAILILASLMTACNTIHGAGQDIEAGGHAIAKAAN